jgi:serine/threonine-protein kinase
MRANRLIGRQVAGRFTIKRFLGEGGMATVFVAEQEAEPREVALKIMNEDLSADRTFVKRFQREAKAAARVQHPNSVAIIDYGVAEGLSYIAMELLAGDDLYVLLEREGAITQGRAARILIEVCDALMVAHELGIVHRDLKPENIMVIPDPAHPNGERVKVLDFGIAKLLAPDTPQMADPRLDPGSAVTRAGTFIGTPAYMSPEQCALLPVDTRADIYTCGVLLFQLVVGRLPFEGQTPLHTATLHIHEPAPRPSQMAPEIDPRLEQVIMKALAKKPTERHQTARHLASTLRKLLPDLPDVRVAKVGKPQPGSLRQSGRTRNQPAPPPAAGEPPEVAMESARTMVAESSVMAPPAVVLHEGAPASDPSADSSPARIRPAPAPPPRPAAGAKPAPAPDDESQDSDDSMRTLVRAPEEQSAPPGPSPLAGAPRFGPQKTEVIMPPSSAAPLPPPPAPPPPANAVSATPGAAPPRTFKPTLKSANEFAPRPPPPKAPAAATIVDEASTGGNGAKPAVVITPPEADEPEAAPANGEPDAPKSTVGDRPSVVTPAAFAATAKVDPADVAAAAAMAKKKNVSETAQTVPMISQAVVQQVIAAGPKGTAAMSAAAAQAIAQVNAAQTQQSAKAPSVPPPPPSAIAPGPAPTLPQTPPVFPLAQQSNEGAVSRISGTRGLLIGFLAGALLMGLFGVLYVVLAK